MFWKKQLPLLIVLVFGIIMLTQYFVPSRPSQDVFKLYLDWAIVIGVFGALMGYYSIIRVHIVKVVKRAKNWQFSIVTLGCILAMLLAWWTQGVETGTPLIRGL